MSVVEQSSVNKQMHTIPVGTIGIVTAAYDLKDPKSSYEDTMRNEPGRMEVLRQIVALVASLGLEKELRMLVANGILGGAVLLRHADGKEVSKKPWRGQDQTECQCTNPNPTKEDGEFEYETESAEESLIRGMLAKRKLGRDTGDF